MADVLLVVHAHPTDEEVLTDVLRDHASAAIHVREETVHGRDFSDASTVEMVSGKLGRIALETVIGEAELEIVTGALRDCRRAFPLRWMAQPVIATGRFE